MIQLSAQSTLHTTTGEWQIRVYQENDEIEHVALVKGDVSAIQVPLVRVHSECLTGDVLGSKHCDCGEQKDAALKKIAEAGVGIFLYMRQEGRGIGLSSKIQAYELQQTEGLDTVEANLKLGRGADERCYLPASLILKDLGVTNIRLLTNNGDKKIGLEQYGIVVDEMVSLEVFPNEINKKYLETKKNKMGHVLKNV